MKNSQKEVSQLLFPMCNYLLQRGMVNTIVYNKHFWQFDASRDDYKHFHTLKYGKLNCCDSVAHIGYILV